MAEEKKKHRNRSQLQRGPVLSASQSNIFQKEFVLVPAIFFYWRQDYVAVQKKPFLFHAQHLSKNWILLVFNHSSCTHIFLTETCDQVILMMAVLSFL